MKKAIFAAAILTLTALSAQAVPKILNYQGFLTEAGTPVTGTRDMTFRVFAAPTGGAALFTEVHAGADTVTVSAGNFSALVGALTAGGIPLAVFDGGDRYMEVTVGVTVLPRQRIVSVAYSIRTEVASGLDSAGDILITPTGNVGIGTALPTAKLDVAGAIEYMAKTVMRFSRTQTSSSNSDAVKDAQCAAEFGPAYAAASTREGISYIYTYINSEPYMTFAGTSNRLVVTQAGMPVLSEFVLGFPTLGPGPAFLACVQKTAPLRFTRGLGPASDSDALKDGRCSAEFGPNYTAATILDVDAMPGVPIGAMDNSIAPFVAASSPLYFVRDSGGSLTDQQIFVLVPVACIHK